MTRNANAAAGDLFDGVSAPVSTREELAPGAVLMRGFASAHAQDFLAVIAEIARHAPFRQMVTPGGYRMSVAMTNCGPFGWVTDRQGYRYDACDPLSAEPWPALPELLRAFAAEAAVAAGFAGFQPDSCLINRYEAGTKLSLHQDRDEGDFTAPIVSVSLGLPAIFLFGGLRRNDRPRRYRLENGDVAVWGGPARKAYHGIEPLAAGEHPLTGPHRYNLTFRKAH
jgi:alkylated DNA repair protein (DNA oxidative demethylase)